MKKMILIASAGAVAFAGAAFAGHHEKMEKGDGKDRDAKIEAHFKEVDANGDGKVTEQEMVDYVTAKAKKEFAAMSGGDGEASLDEAKAYHKAKHEKMMKEHEMKREGSDGE
jgi:Ca2+-binding EF-hand superfamily protein